MKPARLGSLPPDQSSDQSSGGHRLVSSPAVPAVGSHRCRLADNQDQRHAHCCQPPPGNPLQVTAGVGGLLCLGHSHGAQIV